MRALAGPFPQVRFCPTGGVGADNFTDWLALPNVVSVGGSWLAPAAEIRGAIGRRSPVVQGVHLRKCRASFLRPHSAHGSVCCR